MTAPRDTDIPVEFLRECFELRADGRLFWKRRPREHFGSKKAWAVWNAKHAGNAAGCFGRLGYLQISINNRSVRGHRIVWCLTSGTWPANELDHIDGNPANNRYSNLREANHSQQMQNQKVVRNNLSGLLVSVAMGGDGTRKSNTTKNRFILVISAAPRPRTKSIL